MIVSISGKVGSGKDTVANILQYLYYDASLSNLKRHEEYIISDVLADWDVNFFQTKRKTTWETVRAADKLKSCVCTITDCSRSDLEDREFKEKELGEEWRIHFNYHTAFVIDNNFRNAKMGKLFFTRQEALEERAEAFLKNGINLETHTEVLTRRTLMELLGTDCGRNIIHPNIWINGFKSKYNHYLNPMWVCPDTKFLNEYKNYKSIQPNMVSVGIDKTVDKNYNSDKELNLIPIDCIINNNGTRVELIQQVIKLKVFVDNSIELIKKQEVEDILEQVKLTNIKK
jgi:hypothetical protein